MSAHLFVLYRRPKGEKRQLLLDSLLEKVQVVSIYPGINSIVYFYFNATE